MAATAELLAPVLNGRVTILDPLTHALASPTTTAVQALGAVELLAELMAVEAAVAGTDTLPALLELIRREAQLLQELSRRRTVL